jgi:hypothetical protein
MFCYGYTMGYDTDMMDDFPEIFLMIIMIKNSREALDGGKMNEWMTAIYLVAYYLFYYYIFAKKPTKFNQSNTLNAYWSLLSNECFASGMMDIYNLVLMLVLDFCETVVGGRGWRLRLR